MTRGDGQRVRHLAVLWPAARWAHGGVFVWGGVWAVVTPLDAGLGLLHAASLN